MFVIAVVSAKGGVGKTTVSANLGVALAMHGRPVLMIDLDPQNALQWHLGGPEKQRREGISDLSRGDLTLAGVAQRSALGPTFIPFGQNGEPQRIHFEAMLDRKPFWLAGQLGRSGLPPDTIVILDTPPGPSEYLKQAIQASDFILGVMLADAASFATLPEMEELILSYGRQKTRLPRSAYLINQGSQRQLARDVVSLYERQLGPRMIPFVLDEHSEVEEALAFEQPVLTYRPDSITSKKIQAVTDWLINYWR